MFIFLALLLSKINLLVNLFDMGVPGFDRDVISKMGVSRLVSWPSKKETKNLNAKTASFEPEYAMAA